MNSAILHSRSARCIKAFCLISLLCFQTSLFAVWQAAKGPLTTRWAKDVSPDKALPEHPRPQMARQEWLNLNGLWDFAIREQKSEVGQMPDRYDGQILVPFPVESALSGVMKNITEKDRLWYRRAFDVPRKWKGQRVLLHFGAVDFETAVFVNGKPQGR